MYVVISHSIKWQLVMVSVQLGPYPPNTLARESLPPKLRAGNLVLDEEKVSPDLWDFEPALHRYCPNTVPSSFEDATNPSNPSHQKGRGKGRAQEPKRDLSVSPEEDEKTQLLSQGLTLLLAARERVLSLSEQRVGPFPHAKLLLLILFA